MKQVVDAAKGRWGEILSHFHVAVPPHGKHGPCPACGGKDRFRYDDKEGRGTFYCSACGAGDGFYLLRNVKGLTIPQAVDQVRDYLGLLKEQKARQTEDPKAAMRALWDRGRRPVEGGPVQLYLERRLGRCEPPLSIREASNVFDPETKQKFPAMLAKVVAGSEAVNVHITYLTPDGQKAATAKPKRVMAGKLPEGSAIRLAPVAPVMGIAEGVETALSASILFGIPVWACVSGAGLAKWSPPAGVKEVVVFGDSDSSYAGHANAYAAAHRLAAIHHKIVRVEIPEAQDADWNDVLRDQLKRGR